MPDVIGQRGEIRLGYRAVATFGRWTLDPDGAMSSDSVQADPFWATQPGQKQLRVQVGSKWWTWPDCQIASLSPLRARVSGPRVTEPV